MKNKVLITTVFIFLICHFSSGQNKTLKQFTEEDGLAGNIVHDITADTTGILWIATEKGLSKYNGNTFRNYYKSDGLPSNLVWSVASDEKNTIYAACYHHGLALIKNNRVIKVLHSTGLYPNSFRVLHYSKYYKTVFVGTDYGIFAIRDSVLIPIQFDKDHEKKSTITSITETGSRIFITTIGWEKSGLYEVFYDQINPKNSHAERVSQVGRFSSTIMNDSIYIGNGYTVIASPLNDIRMQKEYTIPNHQFMIWSMLPVNNSEIWLGGLGDKRFSGNFEVFRHGGNKLSLKNQIDAQSVFKFYSDSLSNTIWLATDNGLFCAYEVPFRSFDISANRDILDLATKNDSVTVLTKQGVYLLREDTLIPIIKKDRIITKVLSSHNEVIKNVESEKHFSVNRANELSNFVIDKNKLFVQTTKGMISIPDLNTYIPIGLAAFKFANGGAYSNVVYSYLYHFPSVSDYQKYDTVRTESHLVSDIFKIIESNGIYYFASSYNGIYAIRNDRVYSLNESNSAIDNNISDLAADNYGNVWCCSTSGNLFMLGFNDSLYIKCALTAQNSSIIGTYCNWLVFNNKRLFLSTNSGLNIFFTDSLLSGTNKPERFYNAFNGYENITAYSPVKDQLGNIYVHTSDKIIQIQDIPKPYGECSLVIQNIKVNNDFYDLEMIANRKLPYSTKSIQAIFNLIKYPSSRNVEYRYRVNSGDWQSGNQIYLQSLKNGNYKITLLAFDQESQTSYSKVIYLTIDLPIWRKWWFILALITILAGIVYSIFNYRINILKRQHEEKTALITANSELQLRSLQLQMNPHFIFNSLQSLQGYVMGKNVEEGLKYISNLSKVIRANLENASEQYIPLDKEIEFLERYVQIEKSRFGDILKVEFINTIDDANLVIPPMIIQPLIENAIKHGVRQKKDGGLIRVSFSHNQNSVIVEVEDNGQGRKKSVNENGQNHKGKGLEIIQQRLNLLNARNKTNINKLEIVDLQINNQSVGTKVILHIAIPHKSQL